MSTEKKKTGSFYVIPSILSDDDNVTTIPQQVRDAVQDIHLYVVENTRSARRYLRKIDYKLSLDDEMFYELNKHGKQQGLYEFMKQAWQGKNIGLLSEAGCPGVADPGSEAVSLAHKLGLRVNPLTGPSSILLTLMASGFNGQNFAFNGYLPIHESDRRNKILMLEKSAHNYNQTQIFIETPFRNDKLVRDLLAVCHDETRLCIAVDINSNRQSIKTKTIENWKADVPELHKRTVVYALYK